jgi:hypothetical protein
MFFARHIRAEPLFFELIALAFALFPSVFKSVLSLDYGLMVQSIMDAFDY